MLEAIHKQPATDFNMNLVCDFLRAFCAVGAAMTGLALVVYAPPWSSPLDTFDANKYFMLISLPAWCFAVILGVAYFVTVVVHVEIAFRRLALCTMLSSVIQISVSIFSKVVLDIFPIPYYMVTVEIPSALLLFIMIYFCCPRKIRRSPGFNLIMLKTFAVT